MAILLLPPLYPYHFIGCYLATLGLSILFLVSFPKSKSLKLLGLAAAWMAGLALSHWAGKIEATRLLISAGDAERTSEDYLMKIPDGPNITAGWVVSGWIPLLLAVLLTKWLRRKSPLS